MAERQGPRSAKDRGALQDRAPQGGGRPHCYNAGVDARRAAHPEILPLFAISILSIAIQVGFIVHVIKTGRSMLWIVAIGLLPVVGVIAYLVVEIAPEVLGSRAARRARSGGEADDRSGSGPASRRRRG